MQIDDSNLRLVSFAKLHDVICVCANANDLEAATKIIEGSARAMGLQVVEG